MARKTATEKYNDGIDEYNANIDVVNAARGICAPSPLLAGDVCRYGAVSDDAAESQRRKETPIFSGFLSYWPDAVEAVASHSFVNNEKHNPGEPLHWSRDKSNDHLDSLARHLTDIAKGPGTEEKIELLKAVVWRGLAELQLTIEAEREDAGNPDCGVR